MIGLKDDPIQVLMFAFKDSPHQVFSTMSEVKAIDENVMIEIGIGMSGFDAKGAG